MCFFFFAPECPSDHVSYTTYGDQQKKIIINQSIRSDASDADCKNLGTVVTRLGIRKSYYGGQNEEGGEEKKQK